MLITLRAETRMPHLFDNIIKKINLYAKFWGLLTSIAFSIAFLAFSGILKG